MTHINICHAFRQRPWLLTINDNDLRVIPSEATNLLADDVIPRVCKEQRCNIRSFPMKILDWSVETFGHARNSVGLYIHLTQNTIY